MCWVQFSVFWRTCVTSQGTHMGVCCVAGCDKVDDKECMGKHHTLVPVECGSISGALTWACMTYCLKLGVRV
jgi:hypothetical protein